MNFFKHLIVIPARFGSTRFPGKMLAKIHGKTLLQHTYENAKRSTLVDAILIATDDHRIADHAKGLGAPVIMTPVDCPNGTERAYEAIKEHPQVGDETLIINVQGDEPLIDPQTLDGLSKEFQKDPTVVMATLASPFKTLEDAKAPSNVKCIFDLHYNAIYFSRNLIPHTEDPSQIYHHIGVYAFKKEFLKTYRKLEETPLQKLEGLEQLKALEHGYKIRVLLHDKPSFGVDLPSDIQKLEACLCQ